MSDSVEIEQPDRYSRFVTSKVTAAVSLLVLFAVDFWWYSGIPFKTLMGDDMWRWLTFSDPAVLTRIIAPTGDKYRPLVDLFQYPLFKLFSADYQAWLHFNIVFNLLIIATLFLLVRRVTKGDSLFAFAASLLYITTRFAYYSVLQVWGNMEALALLFTLLIVHIAISYYQKPRGSLGAWIIVLYFAAIFTAERYVVLLPFIMLLFFLAERPQRVSKWVLIGIAVLPLAFNIVLKKFVWHLTYLVGPNGEPIVWSPLQVLQFLKNAFANLGWISAGEPSQVMITAAQVPLARTAVIFATLALVIGVVIAAVVHIVREDSETHARELKIAALWATLFLSLVLSSAIAFHQEIRWFATSFVILFVYFFYLFAKVRWNAFIKYGIVALLLVLAVSTDLYFRSQLPRLYFYYSQQMADSALDATYGRYGKDLTRYTIYFDQSDALGWVLADGNFLAPYVGESYQHKVHLVSSFDAVPWAQIDRADTRFLRLDWDKRTISDVTAETLASHPATAAPGP